MTRNLVNGAPMSSGRAWRRHPHDHRHAPSPETGHPVACFGAEDAGMNPRSPHAATAIAAEGLVRAFDGVTAVDHVDLDIARGEIYGFLGPNGAGKSTTVRVLCTLLSPTGGRATVAGYDVARQAEKVRLRTGVALQEGALNPKQTGLQLLRLQGRLYGLSRADTARRLE